MNKETTHDVNAASDLNSELVRALIGDRRRDRRWRMIRFFIIIAIIVAYLVWLFMATAPASDIPKHADYISLVRLHDEIMPGGGASADQMSGPLEHAFADPHSKGVILDINSPGGSVVQSFLIHDQLLQLKKQYNKRLVIVGEDMLTSGAYLIAVAGDEIYVNANTITGSIGVVMSGFGFTDTMKKIGMTRRVFTAGSNKDRLDPFQPLNPEDIKKVHGLLDDAHENFIAAVKQGRRSRLQGSETQLFSGDFWSGTRAKSLGLVDHLGDVTAAMNEVFDVSYYKLYQPKQSLIDSFMGSTQAALHIPGLHATTGMVSKYPLST